MKRRFFRFSSELLKEMLIEGNEHHYRVKQGIPADATIVQCGYLDIANGVSAPHYYMTLEHESFPEAKEGEIQDSMTITVERIEKPLTHSHSADT